MAWDPFDQLDAVQRERLDAYSALLREFNQNVNLISRADERHIHDHHVRHCLYLTHRRFPSGARLVDWGTGGGLPAVPLAVALPDVRIVAIDSAGKKIRAVRAIVRRLGIDNLEVRKSRAEEYDGSADFSISRATAPLADLWAWHLRVRSPRLSEVEPNTWRPGLVCLKGGDLDDEISSIADAANVELLNLADFTNETYFRDKAVLSCTSRPNGPAAGRATRA